MLAPGTRLGSYEIISALGAGGMGEVYLARDTRLERTVAVKILSSAIASAPDLRERFEREARTVASLNHPHICTLHDVGRQEPSTRSGQAVDYIVMEYLEGETLEQRLKKGALPVDQAVHIAIQIADGLAAAHRAGIVHRDLKPGNIMLTRSGAKLLDFGLAKANAPALAGTQSMLPTTPPAMTQQGTILGTFQYMAPEQLEGQDADARSDIFAFGAVLYEMLTGRKAFEAKSQASLIGAIMHAEPVPLSAVQPLAPRSLDRIVRKCLAKDPEERWQTSRDLLDELKWIATAGAPHDAATPVAAPRPRRFMSSVLPWMAAVIVMVAAAAALWRQARDTPVPQPVRRFELAVPPTESPASLALSADSRQLAYVATTEGQSRLWVRAFDDTTARVLAGTEGATFPFWAPDSRAIGFFADAKLKIVDLRGGAPRVLASAPGGRGGTWNSEGVILFTPTNIAGTPDAVVMRIPAAGGTPVQVTRLAPGQGTHRWPQFLPDGRRFLFFSTLGSADQGVYIGSLDGGEPKRVQASETPGVFIAPDRLLLIRGDGLMAAPFDPARGVVTGELTQVAQPVGLDDGVVVGAFSVSPGLLAYRATGGGQRRQLAWIDRTGQAVTPVGAAAANNLSGMALDPGGRRIAVSYTVLGNYDIWLLDAGRGNPTRFTFNPALDCCAVWSPDGRRLIFSTVRNGGGLYEKTVSGAEDEHLLAADAGRAFSWSSDGRFVLYSHLTDLWVLPMTGDGKPRPVVQAVMDQSGGEFSPDSRWLAYESNESGRFELFVQPFPDSGGKWQISTAGGSQPRWSRDGKELYYVAPDARLMAVAIAVSADGKTLDVGEPVVLFRTRLASGAGVVAGRPEYAVAPDGRFLMNTVVEDTAPSPITVVLNWEAGLQK